MGFEDAFHTGSGSWWATRWREGWQAIFEYLRYMRVDLNSSVGDDGTLTPYGAIGYPDKGADFDELMGKIRDIQGLGLHPIIDLRLVNIETVSAVGLRAFLTGWSDVLGENTVIWNPCIEYNQHPDVYINELYVPPDIYNAKMALIRNILDELEIKNILLGSHAQIYSPDIESSKVYMPYLAGMTVCDVLGGSVYTEDDLRRWDCAKTLYDLTAQPEKPFFFFEYANRCFWAPYPLCTADFVDRSYAQLQKYPFVKSLCWLLGDKYEPATLVAIKENAIKYEGYTPIPPITPALIGGVALAVVDAALVLYYIATHIFRKT